MSDPKLARMANNIAIFFQSYPHDQAVTGIHNHLKSFWTPKMRDALHHVMASGAGDLHPLVVEAVTQAHSASQAASPTEKEAAGPAEVGEIGASDAG